MTDHPAEHLARTVATDAHAGQDDKAGEPRRIQLRRTKGWRKPDGAVVVSRPSGWGNPFRIGEVFRFVEADGTPIAGVVHGHRGAVDLFERFMASRPDLRDKVRAELAGRDLACWCPADKPCHADVLLRIANEEETT